MEWLPIFMNMCRLEPNVQKLGYEGSGGDCELKQSEENRQGAMGCSSVIWDPHKSPMKSFT